MEQISTGKLIREARKNLGLTQSELAYKCNLDIRTIQRIEQGEVIPRAYTLRIISNIIGIDLNKKTESRVIDEEIENYRIIFRRRKQFRIATFAATISMLVIVFILAFPSWVLFGRPKHVWAPYFYLILFADILGIIFTWRCPGCNSMLGEVFSTRYCSKCGLKFID